MHAAIPHAETEIGRFFAENGYYHAKKVFNSTEVAELEASFDQIIDQLVSSGEEINARWGGPEMERMQTAKLKVLHTHNVHQYSASWTRALLHPRFLDVVTSLIGPNVMLHHTKLFQKPSEEGAPFPMHQDWTYFPSIQDSMMAGVIHVSNATDEMGCLRVYPGSHKLGRLQESGGQYENEILAKYPLEGATPIEAEPGDVVFFHYLTLHGSKPNYSPHIRKTVLVQMYSGDDRIEDGVTHTDERLVLAGWNKFAKRSYAANK